MKLYPQFEEMLDMFDDVEDMCNQLGLNYDEVYDYDSEYQEDEEDEGCW